MNRSIWSALVLAMLAACNSSTASGGGSTSGGGLGIGGTGSGAADAGLSCPANLATCGQSCVNTASDVQNCGLCAHACAYGDACVSGVCTATCAGSGGALCDGGCVNLQSDQANCGACGKACAAGQSCAHGSCSGSAGGCPAPLTSCGSGELATCTSLQDDPANCGSCGHGCGLGVACLNGQCQTATSCSGGQTSCGGACADTQTDPKNCGSCGHACAASQTCQGGGCVAACAADAGLTACIAGTALACYDLATDPNNCGACGRGCAAGQGCDGGSCNCPTGSSLCGSGDAAACVDTASNPSNCGACGRVCSSGLCHAGSCLFCAAGTYAFGPVVEVDAGAGPSAVAVADFDGDGRPDLAAANAGDGTLGILLGAGSGFAPEIPVAAGLAVAALAVADVNGDGHPDVATLSVGSDAVSVVIDRPQDGGAPSFAVIGPFACTATSNPTAVAVADVNGDGRPDLIVGGSGVSISPPGFAGTLDVFHQQPDGGFPATSDQQLTAGQSIAALAPLRLGVDGGLALAAADQNGGAVLVIPAATLSGAQSYPTGNGPVALAAGDLNGDGAADLVALNQGDGTVTVLTAQPGGTFQAGTAIPVVSGAGLGVTLLAQHVAVGDVNGDGWLDILVTVADQAPLGQDAVVYLLNVGNGSFAPAVSVPAAASAFSPGSVALHDLNGDGLPDLALGNVGSGPVVGVLYGQCP